MQLKGAPINHDFSVFLEQENWQDGGHLINEYGILQEHEQPQFICSV